MQEFAETGYAQMRLVTAFETLNQLLSMALIASTTAAGVLLWQRGAVGVGAVAAATAMAVRLNGISQWIMWEMATLFEHVGTVQDGIATFARARTVVDRPDAKPLVVTRGALSQPHVSLGTSPTQF